MDGGGHKRKTEKERRGKKMIRMGNQTVIRIQRMQRCKISQNAVK